VSTFFAGCSQFAVSQRVLNRQTGQMFVSIAVWPTLLNGLIFSGGVLAILVCHEMGHYLQARRYGVPASWPYFIPMPFSPFGTMGAVIVQQAGVADRKSMFDIAITGPLAGLVVALPLAWWGIQHSEVVTPEPGQIVHGYGDPLILKWIVRHFFGPLEPNQDVLLNPLLFAGWVGVFITALNLIPIGQLDGGHILYCLLRRKAHGVARGLFFIAAGVVAWSSFFGDGAYATWFLMLMLLWMMGTRHPPTSDDNVPLGTFRVLLGWLTLMFIVVGFTPRPIYETRAAPVPRPRIQPDRERDIFVQELPARNSPPLNTLHRTSAACRLVITDFLFAGSVAVRPGPSPHPGPLPKGYTRPSGRFATERRNRASTPPVPHCPSLPLTVAVPRRANLPGG
jgi:Zn-dependent protease